MSDEKKTFIKYTWEQLERAKAGDMAAIGQFIEDNDRFLRGWAWNVMNKHPGVIPKNEYEPQDCINQVCVDFPYYEFDTIEKLVLCMFRSYIGVAHGGIKGKRVYKDDNECTTSLDAPLGISKRSGERENGATLGDLLPNGEPSPLDVLERREHVKEIAPLIYRELANLFSVNSEPNDTKKQNFTRLRETIEEIFCDMTFEEVRAYAEVA